VRYAAVVLTLYVSGLWSAASPLLANTGAPKTGFVTANSVKLHYLDWGGSGDTILFLPGFNDTAHVYDHFAPRFGDHFHVIGLTRRGVGESDKPADGYDASTRVEDIRQFLETLGIRKVCLIGHSMAGDELTLFATRYPDRVTKLVYLDAAYDRTRDGYLAGLTDPTNKPDMMRRMRMEALGMPEAADIPGQKNAPSEGVGDPCSHSEGSLRVPPRLHKGTGSGTRFLRCHGKPTLSLALVAKGRGRRRLRKSRGMVERKRACNHARAR